MKNLKFTFLLAIVFSAGVYPLQAQNSKELMYKAYLLNSEALWKQAISHTNDTWEKALASYGLLNNTMATQNEEVFDDYLDTTLDLLEGLENDKIHKAEALALRSSTYGFIMGYSPWKGMYYGSKSSSAIDKALEITENSGIVWMVKGSSLFYTPETFGGDKLEAEKAFEKSIQSFEAKGDVSNNWLYLNALASLGKTYNANGKKELAIATYEKALAIEASFTWVSKVLLPQAKK